MTKKIIIILLVVAAFAIISFAYFVQWPWRNGSHTQPVAATSTQTQSPSNAQSKPAAVVVAASSTVAQVAADHIGMKLYHNNQWGFEFWYPEGWEWKENVFGSPYSRFNLTAMKINGQNTNQNDVLNVVTTAFESNAVLNYHAMKATTSTILVDGIPVIEYRYKFEGVSNIDVDIPLGDNKILFGVEGVHGSEFDSILSSFKFIK